MLPTGRCIKKRYIHAMEYHPAMDKSEIMPPVARRIDLETVILKNKSGKDKYHVIRLIYGIYRSYK